MEKLELVKALTDQGIDAHIEDGIVMIRLSLKEYEKPSMIKKIIKETGYESSWGIRCSE